ncbi:2-succinyl-6-hydroxy-2,4-cyclohexadiene-1-carboxylate synthase [Alicyclobacillus herbarius]|uniref:2-succinyl-6-hydroxy-2, 4-cyclohexadiene-1-carboxylate synthase n=1 Tax=Alicyclobacillus herbarius TaxID=122960 RepID=UPI0004120656|nr:2-succinyl-6-hydroxy-2,4-cyclohexadiene-1-carboxylate synthase [Alicyclobacillus herbarius]
MTTQALSVRGVTYHVEEVGEGKPLLLLHGFTGSGRVWQPFVSAWPGWRLVMVDLLGHGHTQVVPPSRCTMEHQVQDLLYVMDALGHSRFACLGYSMGGRVALALAVTRPHRLLGLILESSSPGLAAFAERSQRRQTDEELASFIEQQGIEAFVQRWESIPLFSTQRRLDAGVLARQRSVRLAQATAGLAASLRGMGTGCQCSYWPQLGRLRMPTRLIVGAWDTKYRAIAEAMRTRNPALNVEVVNGAGHTVHLEQPTAFAESVRGFLAEVAESAVSMTDWP